MSQQFDIGLMWFRRDLRVTDNAALHMALKACRQLHCVFVFDRDILDGLPRIDRRVEFIRESLVELDQDLRQLSGHKDAGLIVRHAKAVNTIAPLAQELRKNSSALHSGQSLAGPVRRLRATTIAPMPPTP